MTTYRVEPARLDTLAERLDGLAHELWWTAQDAQTRSWAVGPGRCRGLLEEALGDFEHQRLVLGRAMEELAGAVRGAGALYADVDDAVASTLGSSHGPSHGPSHGSSQGSGQGSGWGRQG